MANLRVALEENSGKYSPVIGRNPPTRHTRSISLYTVNMKLLILVSEAVFEISAIWLRAGPTRSENSSGPGRLGRKFLRAGPTWSKNSSGPGRADLGRKFFRAGPGRPGPKILPGRADLGRKFFRAGPIPKNKFDVK